MYMNFDWWTLYVYTDSRADFNKSLETTSNIFVSTIIGINIRERQKHDQN